MQDAYALEQRIVPAVIKMESSGVKISCEILAAREKWEKRFEIGDQYLRNVVGDIKLGGKLMFNTLRAKGVIDETKIVYTKKGNPRYGKDFLPYLIKDKKLKSILVDRSRMQKVIGTYLKPWSEAYKRNGRFYP